MNCMKAVAGGISRSHFMKYMKAKAGSISRSDIMKYIKAEAGRTKCQLVYIMCIAQVISKL
jgi:hypothetical protein